LLGNDFVCQHKDHAHKALLFVLLNRVVPSVVQFCKGKMNTAVLKSPIQGSSDDTVPSVLASPLGLRKPQSLQSVWTIRFLLGAVVVFDWLI
jgi:hypothetical protein